MFRNLATLFLYISILFYNVKLPYTLLLLYTFCIIIGDGFEYFPKNMQKILYPINYFFENKGPLMYNIEFAPIVLLSIYIFIHTLVSNKK